MKINTCSFVDLSDDALIGIVKRLAAQERQATAQLVASLAELDARRLYLGAGCASSFTYCTQVLHLSEHAAYNRIEAARAARRFPVILERLADGSVTLTAVRLLAPHVTDRNVCELLEAARHKSKRDVEVLLASLRPQPPVPSSVRKLPSSGSSTTSSSSGPANGTLPAALLEPVSVSSDAAVPVTPLLPALPMPMRKAVVQPLTPERYRIQFTASRETVDKLRRVQELLRHVVPTGDPAAIVDRALTVLLAQLEKTKLGATDRPRLTGASTYRRSRHIPARVRRTVWARDEGRCTFVGTEGRCAERSLLEYHHVVPYAAGGDATVEQITLRCAAHNRYEAALDFGGTWPRTVRERRESFSWSGLVPERASPVDNRYCQR